MQWEIYALRYGIQERRVRDNFIHPPGPRDAHDAPMPLDYFVWLLRAGSRQILVDTGFGREVAERRIRTILRPVEDALRALGCEPAAVEDVVITHLHYDHAGNLDLFPNARIHVQDREVSFATGRQMCFACTRAAFEVEDVVRMVRAVYAERVVFHDGDGEVAPGVSVHHVGGHTAGLQVVRVETARGPVVLASDASHYYANMERREPFPICFNLGEMTAGWLAAQRLAGGDANRVVPGHDPEVRRRYPALPGSDGETVLLHVAPLTR
ncbi:MBL fold hydrolase [Burkholderia sp. WAC0059]|uniref:N-acyl homoserine lactonase family protein n=1 Tax=Burkholderia sp. WAC0059 TaxID=2066022 RepID=UPI000C7EB629|nr:N-acyl homoserine lactonase family protein [Burkholderia sp. WAC0059]PLZ01107.1 MBL fold hydrolase [Burkholderia sp. WAC0059]